MSDLTAFMMGEVERDRGERKRRVKEMSGYYF